MRALVVFILLALLVIGGVIVGHKFTTPPAHAPTLGAGTSQREYRPMAYVLDSEQNTLREMEGISTYTGDASMRARAVVDALIRFSADQAHANSAPLPSGSKVNSLTVHDELVTIDFNAAFADRGFWGGSEHEYLALRALVNSLTEIPGLRRVKITVDGRQLDSLGGHEDLSQPLERDESVLPAKGRASSP